MLQKLGLNRNPLPFNLDSTVVPVAVVVSEVDFIASLSPAYRVQDIFTAGSLTAPGAGTVLADTGALEAGAYTMQFLAGATESFDLQLQWRDVANAVSLWDMRMRIVSDAGAGAGTRVWMWNSRFSIDNTGERVRLIIPGAGGVGQVYQASILARV